MRQTGRTSRIVDFVIDQLHQNLECVATDHTAYEFGARADGSLRNFIDRVKRRLHETSNGRMTCEGEIISLGRGSRLSVVHFTAKMKEKEVEFFQIK